MIKKSTSYILPFISIIFIFSLLFQPSLSIGAAKTGLLLWFNTVLPSLLPFIIASNLLMESGSIYFFEKIFEPIMRPLFNLPACCAFPWIIGLISGYPMGAKTAADLYNNNKITETELQRLLSFCNNSGPFFIIGAVGIGMLSNPKVGYMLLIIHLISSILVGISFRFYKYENSYTLNTSKNKFHPAPPIGEMLGKSISNSMDVIVQIGGYIIIFSVIGTLFSETSAINTLADTIYYVFRPLGMTKKLALSWIIGLIEMSNGVHIVANTQALEKLRISIISFILAWGGLSIHAQSLNFTKKIAISTPVYLLSKFLHGTIAFMLTYLFLF